MSDFIHKYYSALFVCFLLIIVGLSYYLGYQEGGVNRGDTNNIVFSFPAGVLDKQKIPLSASVIENQESSGELAPASISAPTPDSSGAYMGSKNGTKYYTPGCPGSKRIKPENYIWFQSIEDATLQGYSKGSC